MIKITKCTYKNIMSVGNSPITVDFTRWPTTIIGGDNGSGKSTSALALVYGLYGKFINGLKLEQGINAINKKNLLVVVDFERYGEKWQVIRGEKPKKFEIYRDGEMLDQAANSRDQQSFLELVLGMDYKLFTQIVVINKERYVPFMEMTAQERRKVVEDILDIGVFSYMNDTLKQKIKEIDNQDSNLRNDFRVKKTELDSLEKTISHLNQSIKESVDAHNERVANKKRHETEVKAKIAEYEDQLSRLTIEGWDIVKKQISGMNNLSSELSSDISRLTKQKKFFEENNNCPTCSQPINDSLKNEKTKEFDSEISTITNTAEEMLPVIEDLYNKEKEFSKINSMIEDIKSSIKAEKKVLSAIQFDIKELSSKTFDSTAQDRLDKCVDDYNSIEIELGFLSDEIEAIHNNKKLYLMVADSLKDTGVKSVIVKEYIATINKLINEYLNSMGFYVNMTIDENFKESFHSMNRSGFSYENLSTGQKCRVSIAITLALLEVAAIKNSAVTNVLYLDELLEPIDADGVKAVMNLFKQKLSHKNIFCITQRFDEFADQFHSSIRFKLNQGFTEIEQ